VPRKIALVSCASRKIGFETTAETLYSSDLFRKASRLAEKRFDHWYILSAKHGLLAPQELVEPYDETLNKMSIEERKAWAEKVSGSLKKILRDGDEIFFFAGLRYREFLEPSLRALGHVARTPATGLSIGRQLQWLNVHLAESQRLADLDRFYFLLKRLSLEGSDARLLQDSSGKLRWPSRGLYFFFDPLELRSFDSKTCRIVRVGTHAVSRGSKSTLWGRLRTHRGSEDGQGNHRGSIFRLHVGAALQASREGARIATWGVGQSAEKNIRAQEEVLEREVSGYLSRLAVIVLGVEDDPGPASDRSYLERNSIGLLCGPTGPVDLPSEGWLGRNSRSPEIRSSGIWNIDHVFTKYDTRFLNVLEQYVDATIHGRPMPTQSLAPAGWHIQPPATPSATQLSLLLDDAAKE